MQYAAPLWLPGGHLQTIWPALQGRRNSWQQAYQRTRWKTPDQDFIDVDWLQGVEQKDKAASQTVPLLVLFHGLEGSSQSHYARAFAQYAVQRGWRYAVPHFRGCSGEINRAARAYHSGDHAEVDWMLRHLKAQHQGPLIAVGVSLGGNALLRWAQESGTVAGEIAAAIAAVCSPIDLAAGGWALGRGVNRLVYTPMFLKTMKHKALQKLAQHPGLFNRDALLQARTLYAFDNVFTAPLHGFRDTDDYWARASARPHLAALRIPTLLLHARNDPFVPAWSLPRADEAGQYLTLWQPAQGGHVGFPAGAPPGHQRSLPDAVGAWLGEHVNEQGKNHG